MAETMVGSNPKPKYVRRILPLALTIVIGIALSMAAYLYTNEVERQRLESEFNQLATGRATAIRKEVDLHVGTLGSTRSLYATENVGRAKFRNFTSDTLKQYKSTTAMMWIPRIMAGDRQAFELGAERDGLPNFHIVERHDDNQFHLAGQREEYFPAYFVEVSGDYEIVLGLDASSDSAWLSAMVQARDEGRLVAAPSERTTARGANTDNTKDIIVFNPIYQIGLPRETVEQRRKNFLGFTAAIYRIGGLVEEVLKTFKSADIGIVVFDDAGPSGSTLLYGNALPPAAQADSGAAANMASGTFGFVTTFDVAGRKWSIAATPSTQYGSGKLFSLPRITLAAGLSFTGLLALFFLGLIRRTTQVEKLVTERTAELSTAYQQLKESEAQLIQSEKMASLGQMVAGIAHEINTPLGYVSSTVELLGERMSIVNSLLGDFESLAKMMTAPGTEDGGLERQFEIVSGKIKVVRSEGSVQETSQLLKDSIYGLKRIQEIVVGLKDFSRLDRAMIADYDINKGLDQTLLIAQNLLKNKVAVTKHYDKLPKVAGSPSQINQVLLNIIKNAAESIDKSGKIVIKTWRERGMAKVSVEDTGCGIPADILPKIFDPFFTTKEVGAGTGLGLSICYKIIKQHGGDIAVSSETGKGTTFVVSLPMTETMEIRKTA